VIDARDLQAVFDDMGIRYFKARRYLRLSKTGVVEELPDDFLPATKLVVQYADALRELHGSAIICGNGYRPVDYNERVGGSKNSAHIRGAAMDLDPTRGHSDFALLCARAWLGTKRMHGLGVYNRRVHIDVDHDGSAGKRAWPRRWVPSSKLARLLRKAKKLGAIDLDAHIRGDSVVA